MRFRYFIHKTSIWLSDLPVGGSWGRTLSTSLQKNLRWFWFDGLFASSYDNIILNFMSLYILSLGAVEYQIGLMSSLSNFTSAILLFVGAIMAEKIGKHKEISLFCGGIFGRLIVLLLVFVPILFKGVNLVWIAIPLAVLRDGLGNLGYPSWMSVVNETVPIEGRGRFFGSRNFMMTFTGMIAVLIAGKVITLFTDHTGYQIALAIAFVVGLASTFSFAHIKSQGRPRNPIRISSITPRAAFSLLKNQPQFLALVFTAGVWNFAINISAPFFNVHMVKDLGFSASTVGAINVITSLSGLVVLNRIGSLSDRLGPRKLQLITMWLIPSMPIAWMFARSPWHVALINLFGGAMWAAYNLTSFNMMLNSIPQNQVPRYSAMYQIMVTLSMAFGALLGSALIDRWNFTIVMFGTLAGRIIAAILFAVFVREPQKSAVNP